MNIQTPTLVPIREHRNLRCPACGKMEREKPRSIPQNKRLWKLYEFIADETGHTREEIHAACKEQFLGREFITIGKNEIQIPKSTTRLNTVEMTNYQVRVEQLAAELNIVLPFLPEYVS